MNIRIFFSICLFLHRCVLTSCVHASPSSPSDGNASCNVVNWTLTDSTMSGLCGSPIDYEEDRSPLAVGCNPSDTSAVRFSLANKLFTTCFSRCLFGLNASAYAWNSLRSCWIRSPRCLSSINESSDRFGTLEQRVSTIGQCSPPPPPVITLNSSECSETCGEGELVRWVTSESQGEWKVVEPCENYDGCGFSITCPFGEGSGSEANPVSCTAQFWIGVAAFSCSGVCVCLCCLLYTKAAAKARLKAAKQGTYKIKEYGNVEYRIRYPKEYILEEQAPPDELWLNCSQIEDEERIHVLWCLEKEYINKLADENEKVSAELREELRAEIRAEIRDASLNDGKLPNVHAEGDLDELAIEGVPFVEKVAQDDGEIPDEGVASKTMFEDGDRVEYYSSQGRWIAGTVSVEIDVDNTSAHSGKPADPRVWYHVHFRGESKYRVAKDCLRKPLQFGELVEYYSDLAGSDNNLSNEQDAKAGGGGWVAGEIFGLQYETAANIGYKVRLSETHEVLYQTQANRLRLRYPPYMKVLVYIDVVEGWVQGVVDESAPANGLGAMPVLNLAPPESNNPLALALETSNPGDAASPREGSESDLNTRQLSASSRRPKTKSGDSDLKYLPGRVVKTEKEEDFVSLNHDQITVEILGKKMSRDMKRELVQILATPNVTRNRKEFDLWVEVPVLCEGSSEVKVVPSYLLRPVELTIFSC